MKKIDVFFKLLFRRIFRKSIILSYNIERKIYVYYVAFSGGKDSVVTLDLVQRALPHDAFKVVFSDTGMEFSDTYDNENIDFLISKSHFEPTESWGLFGPPCSVTCWCCSVHKTAPQILLLRQVLNKPDFTGMAFVGIRADESLARSKYDYIVLLDNLTPNPTECGSVADIYNTKGRCFSEQRPFVIMLLNHQG